MSKSDGGKRGAASTKTKAKDEAAKAKQGKASAAPTRAAAAGAAGESARDWSKTLFLPKTDFPMKAGLPELEPRLLQRWGEIGLYERLREAAHGKPEKPKFVLHDGPPFANGHIHIGHALNKILKDLVVKSQTMLGQDSNYVPGWDCHGLPIEWKIEEQYRAKGRNKDAVPINEFRAECRAFAEHWVEVQREEFKRLGVVGDWAHPYLTMDFASEAIIAAELMKFAMNGTLYRGSKPVMWSVVEKTALAEAEVEYQDYTSDQIWVKFPIAYSGSRPDVASIEESEEPGVVEGGSDLAGASVVIWTTTPWTIPGNRAISFSSKIAYGLYEVTAAPEGNWAQAGERLILADKLAAEVMKAAKVESFARIRSVSPNELADLVCAHPLRRFGFLEGEFVGYGFDVPLLDGDHVTDDTGTGFVHTAPGHGADDYNIWTANAAALKARGIDPTIPFTVDADGVMTKEAPGFTGKRVLTEKGDKGDANDAVIKALVEANALIARGRLKHQYPHSWRSKKPVIFRNTPQWFIALDKPVKGIPKSGNQGLRELALRAITETEWVPASGENRIRGMIEGRPDWVISRQRAWGVPITVFVHKETGEVIPSPKFAKSKELIDRIFKAFSEKGADVWYKEGAAQRFLDGLVPDPTQWEQVRDILDVWFESGSTHAFVLDDAKHFPGLAGLKRVRDGGRDRVMYLEGSDQHRGWFQSSLLESCGSRGRAPFDVVLTHGFILDEKGEEKMSKSKGNTLSPQEVMKTSGADIVRLWVASADFENDIRFGPAIVQASIEAYRKLRNTLRWMLGALAHLAPADRVKFKDLRDLELERLMLHRLAVLDHEVRAAYAAYDYRKVVALLSQFMNTELSAFYFDVRKDALYCEPYSSVKRRAALTVIEEIFNALIAWLAPILAFTAEEAWLSRHAGKDGSVHLERFPEIPTAWRNDALAAKWERVRDVRRVVTGALELERAAKRIGSSLEAAPDVYVSDGSTLSALEGVELAEVLITSDAKLIAKAPPSDAFTLPDVPGVGVVPKLAQGKKCARSWRIVRDVGADPEFPDLSLRDAAAVREFDARAESGAQ
ncbi:MAG TPA: isoleucine--tRNA ligase [Hyphomicrobium sp.]|nr:isoleucine--tRNA ligase [Hyphomicrobium sp.]